MNIVRQTTQDKGVSKLSEEVVKSPAKAIRKYCIECCREFVDEVRNCPAENCVLHPFRFGKNPFRITREVTDEQKRKMAEGRERYLNEKKNNSEEKDL